MKPCPFCGKVPDLDDPDTVYPSGTGWKIRFNGLTQYVNFRDVPKEQWCYSLHCVTTSGGCGVEMHGDTLQDCLDKWNSRLESPA